MKASKHEYIALFTVVAAMAALIALAIHFPRARTLSAAITGSQTAPDARQAEGESLSLRITRIVKQAATDSPDGPGKEDEIAGFRTVAIAPLSDPQDVMTNQDESEIARCIRDIQQTTGVPTAVVTLRSTGGSDAHELAEALLDKWKSVKKNQREGLLLLFVAEPPQRGILVEFGSKLEEAATEEISRMLRQQPLPPYPENADWREGVVSSVKSVRDYLAGKRRGSLRPGPAMAAAADRKDWD